MARKERVEIPTMGQSLNRLLQLPDDIRLIQEKEGIGLTQLARSLDVSKQGLWYWKRGRNIPREPLVLLSLLSWADKLRDKTPRE